MSIGEWLVLALTCLACIGGLFLAASSDGGAVYGFGLVVSAGAVSYAGVIIKRYFDRLDQARH